MAKQKNTHRAIILTILTLSTLVCSSCSSRKTEQDELKSRSVAAFSRFEQVWNFNDFWKRGNTFDACLHFVDAASIQWPNDPAIMAIRETVTRMIKNKIDGNFDVNAFGERTRSLVSLIGHGVQTALVGQSDGIIREAPCEANFGPHFGRAYLAGRGILMRYLGEKQIQNLMGVDLSGNIRPTADAIWETRDPNVNQFMPEYTTHENDSLYIKQFRSLWGLADEVYRWDIRKELEPEKIGVCQAIGLDALGTAIRQIQ
jgi:hypothetical protein